MTPQNNPEDKLMAGLKHLRIAVFTSLALYILSFGLFLFAAAALVGMSVFSGSTGISDILGFMALFAVIQLLILGGLMFYSRRSLVSGKIKKSRIINYVLMIIAALPVVAAFAIKLTVMSNIPDYQETPTRPIAPDKIILDFREPSLKRAPEQPAQSK